MNFRRNSRFTRSNKYCPAIYQPTSTNFLWSWYDVSKFSVFHQGSVCYWETEPFGFPLIERYQVLFAHGYHSGTRQLQNTNYNWRRLNIKNQPDSGSVFVSWL